MSGKWFASSVLALLPACQLIVGSDDPVPLELDSLVVTPGGLDQAFQPETHFYTATPSYTDAIKVTPTSLDPEVSIKVRSTEIPPDEALVLPNGAQHEIRMLSGANGLSIELSTPQGVTTSYTVTVTVPGARFAAPESAIPLSGNPTSLKTADFDLDGTPDVAVCTTGGVFVFDGEGSHPLRATLPAAPCLDFAIGDLDNANGPDVVVVTRSGAATVFRNNGAGTFPLQTSAGGGTSYISVALGLLDGDANLDLILGDEESGAPFGRVQWRLGNGDGTFDAIAGQIGGGGQTVAMVVGELDAETGTDVVGLDGGGAAILLIHGDGAGVLVKDTATDTTPMEVPETRARSLVLATADANPVPDYALVHGDRDELAVIRNFAGSDTVMLTNDIFPTAETPTSVVATDLDGDGHEDLIVACKNATAAPGNPTAGRVMLFYGDGEGGYVPMSFASPAPIGVAVADFNGDGLSDLAVLAESSTEGVHILLQEPRP